MSEPRIETQTASDGYSIQVAVWPARGLLGDGSSSCTACRATAAGTIGSAVRSHRQGTRRIFPIGGGRGPIARTAVTPPRRVACSRTSANS